MSSLESLFIRDDDDGSGHSKQTVIIIAVCSGVGALVLAYFLFLAVRKCRRSSHSAPHPLPQPLAHHRQHHIAQAEQANPRLATWYDPQFTAAHRPPHPHSAGGSKISLLGSDGQALTPSSTDTARDPSISSHHRLPIPSASYLNRPSSRSSLSSDTSYLTSSGQNHPPLSTDAPSFPPFPRLASQSSSMTPPGRRARPLSISSSTYTHGSTRTSRLGVPHAPHNQIQIVLPAPLASANNSRDSLPIRTRYGSDAQARRSVADPWINAGSAYSARAVSTESLPEMVAKPRKKVVRRHASVASAYPILYEGETMPPVPPLNYRNGG